MHLNGNTNDDVTCFYSSGPVFNYFPTNINEYFQNTEYIRMYEANIASLSKNDFQQFGNKLKVFYFDRNPVEVIDRDLFIYNANLEKISFYFNRVKHVETGALKNLQKLKMIYFSGNPSCPASDVHDRSAVINFVSKIESQCKNQQVYQKYLNQLPITTSTTTSTTTEKVKSEQLMIENHQGDVDRLINEHTLMQCEKIIEAGTTSMEKMLINMKDTLKSSLTQKFNEMELKMEQKIEALKKFIDDKLETIDKKLDINKDDLEVKFITINSTCSGLNLELFKESGIRP